VDFVAVVDQVIALLRQRGRVAYRTLKVQWLLLDSRVAQYQHSCHQPQTDPPWLWQASVPNRVPNFMRL